MKTLHFRFTLFLCALLLPFLLHAQEDSLNTDLLDEMQALQAAMPAPGSSFRSGHVSPREIADYLQPVEQGFRIRLPRRSLTPSPTVYQGKLYVSGGFGSKEFYAFDAENGALVWALDLDDDGPSSAVVEEDVVVFNTESCTIFACDAATGKLLWSHYLGDPLMSTPSISNGLVFTAYPAAGSSYGNLAPQQQGLSYPTPQAYDAPAAAQRLSHVLIALDLHSGAVRWQQWIDGDVMSAPVVEGDELYVSTFPGTLFRFSAETGELLAATASRATSAPVIAAGEIYLSRRADNEAEAVSEQLSVLDRQQGLSRGYAKRPAPYLDHKVQAGSQLKEAAAAYDAGNGFAAGAPAQSGWQAASLNIGQSNVSSLQSYQGSRMLVYGGNSYASMGDEIVCVNTATGEEAWRHRLPGDLQAAGGHLAAPPLRTGNEIIVATLQGSILRLDAETGRELARYETGASLRFQPVVDAGRIYVSSTEGQIICIDTGEPALSGWPCWGGDAAHSNRPE